MADEPVDEDPFFAPASEDDKPRKRKRPKRMSQVISELGSRGRAYPGATKSAELVQGRARKERARQLSEGGRSKGEERGFGATSGKKPAK